MLTERRRRVRKQYEGVQQRRVLQDMTNQGQGQASLKQVSTMAPPGLEGPSLHLKPAQKLQLQQQMQQVGLLKPTHLPFEEVSFSEAVCLSLSAFSMYSCSPRFTCSVETGTA